MALLFSTIKLKMTLISYTTAKIYQNTRFRPLSHKRLSILYENYSPYFRTVFTSKMPLLFSTTLPNFTALAFPAAKIYPNTHFLLFLFRDPNRSPYYLKSTHPILKIFSAINPKLYTLPTCKISDRCDQ